MSEAAAVGGDQRKFAVLEVEIDAVEDVAGLVRRLGVGDALEHRGELGLFEGVGLFVAELGRGGNSSLPMPMMRKLDPPEVSFT
jgi:hypothetical protein